MFETGKNLSAISKFDSVLQKNQPIYKVLFIIVHAGPVKVITEMYLCSKINDPKYQLHVFAVSPLSFG